MTAEAKLATRPTANESLVRNEEAEMDLADSRDMRAWLESIGSGQDVNIRLVRKAPRVWEGVPIEGGIETYPHFIDEDFIKERFGGGLYQLIVQARNAKGQMQYKASRQVKIAGIPKLDEFGAMTGIGQGNGNGSKAVNVPGGNDLASQALAMTQKQLEQAQARADDRGNRNGLDNETIKTITAPLMLQIEALQSQLSDSNARVMVAMTTKPAGSEFQEKLLDKFMDGDNARIVALRTQFESEVRTLRESAKIDLDRVKDDGREALKAREDQHRRELDTIKTANTQVIENLKLGFDMRNEVAAAENRRLERELTKTEKELAELRGRKDRSLPEQAHELQKLHETLNKTFGNNESGNEDDSKKPLALRALETVMDNPDGIGRLLGSMKGNVMAEPPALPAPIQRRQLPPRPRRMAPQAAAAPAPRPTVIAPAPTGETVPAEAGVREPTHDEIGLAVTFLETAIASEQAPADFAETARHLIPAEIKAFISRVGIDGFLDAISPNLTDDSLLKTMKGRRYAREVASLLLA